MIQRDPFAAKGASFDADRRRLRSSALAWGPEQEAFAQLWRGLLPLLPEERIAVGVAGVKLRAGTLAAAAQLAIAATELDLGPVLLLEGAAGASELPSCFEAHANPGLSDWMRDEVDLEDCLQEISPSQLTLLTYGSAESMDPQSDMAKASLSEALESLRDRFAMVICDLGPTNEESFQAELVPPLDGLLLVVEANHVTDREAKRAKERLMAAGGRLLGAVWSKAASRLESGGDTRR